MKHHKWKKILDPSGGNTVEKCTVCGIECIIDADMPSKRWDFDKFPKERLPIEPDCDSSLVRGVMNS